MVEYQDVKKILSQAYLHVDEIRKGGLDVVQALTCADELTNVKQDISKAAEATSQAVVKLEECAEILREPLQRLKDTCDAVSSKDDQQKASEVLPLAGEAVLAQSSLERMKLARDLFAQAMECFGSESPIMSLVERPSKRRRPAPPTPDAAERPSPAGADQAAAAAASALEAAVSRVRETVKGLAQISVIDGAGKECRPADAVEVRLVCPDVICGIVALGRQGYPEPIRVVSFSPAEPDLQAWNYSTHWAHRRLSTVGTRALNFFVARARYAGLQPLMRSGAREDGSQVDGACMRAGEAALEDLLLWLATYSDLFSKPCQVTGCVLAADLSSQVMLPPLLRPYKLSNAKLREAAADPSKREAYHLHVASYSAIRSPLGRGHVDTNPSNPAPSPPQRGCR
eukprot:CAMPEP_0177617044 /NCGR_PEP_ID=MMETSP0419_2-20121207/24603_1 /TAXON_ID=582737 /ORGANISM="Tetraselmis sp., Strain GSL018" /LENGTH=398 /DNA_ID=CAMNT_0019115391 /DNA_START=105 /DNA_END=1299 /DNA_ORIENTATION=-